MDKPLSTLTKILLIVWAVVTIPGGLALVFYPPFATLVVWPPPLAAIPAFHAQLNGAIGIATGVASIIALRQNRRGGAQPMIGMYVAYALAAEFVAITNVLAGPVAWTVWLYIGLGIFYLVSSFIVWRQGQ
ncbi:MAG: hypothetical protein HYZ49_11750 [Chloroflexi bacterium]|nr:hypothetical protein [Chloroflexota bacterium]